MRYLPPSVLALAACAAFASTAIAQYRSAAQLHYEIGETLRREIQDVNGRKPVDEAKLRACVSRVRDASTRAVSALGGFGEQLSREAKSPHESTLQEPFRRAAEILVTHQRVVQPYCDDLIKLIDTSPGSRPSDFASQLDAKSIGMCNTLNSTYKQFQEFAEVCDKMRRWLADSLKTAADDKERMTQDCKPISDAQNAAWARLNAARSTHERADKDHDQALERAVACEVRENESYERWRDAVARKAPSEEVWALRQRWARSADEELDALRTCLSAFQSLSSAVEEVSRSYVQLVQSQKLMREYTMTTDANKKVEVFNNFARWNETFEREINR